MIYPIKRLYAKKKSCKMFGLQAESIQWRAVHFGGPNFAPFLLKLFNLVFFLHKNLIHISVNLSVYKHLVPDIIFFFKYQPGDPNYSFSIFKGKPFQGLVMISGNGMFSSRGIEAENRKFLNNHDRIVFSSCKANFWPKIFTYSEKFQKIYLCSS